MGGGSTLQATLLHKQDEEAATEGAATGEEIPGDEQQQEGQQGQAQQQEQMQQQHQQQQQAEKLQRKAKVRRAVRGAVRDWRTAPKLLNDIQLCCMPAGVLVPAGAPRLGDCPCLHRRVSADVQTLAAGVKAATLLQALPIGQRQSCPCAHS